MASLYSLLLRLKFVTGSPLVRSLAPTFPTPCGYLLLRFVQFLNNGGAAAPAGATASAQAATAAATSLPSIWSTTITLLGESPLSSSRLIDVGHHVAVELAQRIGP